MYTARGGPCCGYRRSLLLQAGPAEEFSVLLFGEFIKFAHGHAERSGYDGESFVVDFYAALFFEEVADGGVGQAGEARHGVVAEAFGSDEGSKCDSEFFVAGGVGCSGFGGGHVGGPFRV